MRIHWLQHVPFEDLGTIGEWAAERGHAVSGSLALTERFPPTSEVDLLVVMGGPMGVHDDHRFPWLTAEKRYIEHAIDAGSRVLGVCLGAQLVADVLGGSVRRNPEPEIGWFPVTLTPEGRASSVFGAMPSSFVAGHWHSDTFEPPADAVRTASSEACANQAFEWRGRVYGVQFHLEWDARALGLLVDECGEELVAGRYIQSPEQLLGNRERFRDSRDLLFGLLDALAARQPEESEPEHGSSALGGSQ